MTEKGRFKNMIYHPGFIQGKMFLPCKICFRDDFDCWLFDKTESGSMFEINVESIQLGNDPSKANIECLDKINLYACESPYSTLFFG